MEWQVVVVLLIAIPVILFPAAFVWHLTAGGIYQAVRESRKKKAEGLRPSFAARSVPMLKVIGKSLLPAVAVVLYSYGISYFLGAYGWPVALAFGLAVPIIAVPAVLIWYLNASGIFRVMQASRRRRTRLARTARVTAEIAR